MPTDTRRPRRLADGPTSPTVVRDAARDALRAYRADPTRQAAVEARDALRRWSRLWYVSFERFYSDVADSLGGGATVVTVRAGFLNGTSARVLGAACDLFDRLETPAAAAA